MFVQLFLVSVVLAAGVSGLVAWLFNSPAKSVLRHLLDEEVAEAWAKYVCFALAAGGVASGARVRILEEHLATPSWNQSVMQGQLTQEFWVLEMYRTAIGTVEGIAWILLALSLVAGIAYLIVQKNRSSRIRPNITQPR